MSSSAWSSSASCRISSKDAPARPSTSRTISANLNAALADFFNKSYFITKNMNATLAGDKVDGVLPSSAFS